MNKMKCFSAALVAFFLSATHLCAQDIEKEFDDFAKQQQQEFEDFKNKADAEFETFLRETWQKYEAFAAIPAPERPEPPKPVEFDKTKPTMPPVNIKPAAPKVPDAPVPSMGEKVPVDVKRPDLPAIEDKPAPGVYVPGKPYTPVLVEVPPVKPGSTVYRTPVEFYGTSFEVALEAADDLSLKGNRESDVADAWKAICKRDYEQMVKDCMTIKKEKNLSDWAYLLFTKQIGTQLYGADWKDFFDQYKTRRMLAHLDGKQYIYRLWNQQMQCCPVCGKHITRETPWKITEMTGSSRKAKVLIHDHCSRITNRNKWKLL